MGILKDVQEGEVEMVWAHDDEKNRTLCRKESDENRCAREEERKVGQCESRSH